MPTARACSSRLATLIVDLARRYYEQDDETALPRIASFKRVRERDDARHRDGRFDQHRAASAAAAYEGKVPFTMQDIDRLSRRVPVLCKVAPSVADVHLEDVHRAGGVMAILGELNRAGLLNRGLPMVYSKTLEDALGRWDIKQSKSESVRKFFMAAPGNVPTQVAFSQERRVRGTRCRPRDRLHPRRRARLFEGWRPRRAVGQHRARRLHREDRRRRRRAS